MIGPGDYHSKYFKSDKEDKYHMILITCGIKKKNDINELIYKTESDSQT